MNEYLNLKDKLNSLLKKCTGVYISEKEYKSSYYEISEMALPFKVVEFVINKMIETDTMITIRFYPFDNLKEEFKEYQNVCDVVHYDVEAAIDLALFCFEDE
jgi:hypothetical protein